MDIVKLSIFSYFSDYSTSGVDYTVCSADHHEWYEKKEDHVFVGYAEVSAVKSGEVVKMATSKLDKEIVDLQIQITQKEEKKKQLLAIEHKEAV